MQINLHVAQTTQDLLYQMGKEGEAGLLLISGQYENPDNIGWHSDNRGDAAIHVLPGTNTQVNSENGNGYIRCVLDVIAADFIPEFIAATTRRTHRLRLFRQTCTTWRRAYDNGPNLSS